MVRLKHRYLLVNILYPEADNNKKYSKSSSGEDVPYALQFRRPSDDRVDAKLLARLIRDGVSELFGDYGSGMIASSLQVKYCSSATSTAIIRVARDHYRLVWAALTFATRLPKPVDQACVMQVVRVSGTIKKAEEEAIRRARLSIRKAKRGQAVSKAVIAGGVAAGGEHINVAADDDGDVDMDLANGIEDADEPGDLDDESD